MNYELAQSVREPALKPSPALELAARAYMMGIDVALSHPRYRKILRSESGAEAEIEPSEVTDAHWEAFQALNEFDDECFACELFKDNFLRGWIDQTELLEENLRKED